MADNTNDDDLCPLCGKPLKGEWGFHYACAMEEQHIADMMPGEPIPIVVIKPETVTP